MGSLAPAPFTNDTKGLVSSIAAASEVYVVNLEASINAFEGANAGTPTIVLIPEHRKIEQDHQKILQILRNVPEVYFWADALVSRGKIGSNRIRRQGFTKILDEAMHERQRIDFQDRPAMISGEDGLSPLENVLRELHQHIKRSVANGWTDWEPR